MKTDFERELDDIFENVDAGAEARLALDIAGQFAALRQRRGLSQAQVAERLGNSQQAISKIEHPSHEGRNLARLKEAVAVLGATLDVRLVPTEDAAAYLALRAPKPALEARDVAGASPPFGERPAARTPNRKRPRSKAAPVSTRRDVRRAADAPTRGAAASERHVTDHH